MIKSPFKFLDSYTLEDRSIFFGRDQEITDLYRRVFESKMLLVYGVSGTGKSSLINCGLASRFDESDWLPVNIRRGTNIVESLNDSINKHAITPFKKSLSVTEKLQSVYLDHFKPVFLIFDQFEELFIFGSEDEKKSFIRLIKEIVTAKIQCRVVFVIREEFLAGITEFEYDLPEIFSNRFRVEKMKRANAILAVEEPCRVHMIKTETGFSEELIDKLCPAGNEIELTYLQIYLDRIFRIASEEMEGANSPGFSKDLLTRAGSVSDLLGQFLDEQIREFDDPEKGMTILKSFVSIQGTKKQMTEVEILDSIKVFGAEIAENDLIRYLEKFVDLRILRERDESGHFELRHDALAAKIYEKFTISEKELLEVRLFVDNAFQSFNTRKTYLTRDDLDYLSDYEKRLFLPVALSNFVEESKEKLYSQQRALRRLTTIVAVVFVIIVAAGIQFYLNKKGDVQTSEFITLALLQEKVDPMTSLFTAFKVREKDSVSTVVEGIILNSFYKLLEQKLEAGDSSVPAGLKPRLISVEGSILSMKMNKSGNHLFGWTDEKEVFTCSADDSAARSFKAENEIVTVEMSDNARYLAVIYKNSKGGVFTPEGRKTFDFETTVNNLMNNRLIRFFPAGKYFMAAVRDNKAAIYDSSGINLFDLEGHTGRINSLDISPDGRFVSTVSCDKSGIIWNFNHDTGKFSPYDTLSGHADTVWSCEFNSTGKYILTASADSMINIWDLNGKIAYVYSFTYAVNSPIGIFFSKAHAMDLSDSIYWDAYFNKRSDARFMANDRAIVASNYTYSGMKSGNNKMIYSNQVVFYGLESAFNPVPEDNYVSISKEFSGSAHNELFSLMEISSDRSRFAAITSRGGDILVFTPSGYQLLSFSGNFPVFSNHSNELFYLKDKSILKAPLDLNIIHKMVFGMRLFGTPEIKSDIWKIL